MYDSEDDDFDRSIFVGAWNVAGRSPFGSLAVDVSEWLNLKDAADMFQEIVPLKTNNVIGVEDPTEATNWNCTPEINTRPELSKAQNERGAHGGSKYKLMASKKMVGVFISVWMKMEFLTKYCISNVKVSSVACGIMGYLGNKAAVSGSMSIEGTSFCFIAAHLASGEKRGDEGRRNHQVSEIFRRTSFPNFF
ncbi:hypothetical protein DKX38_026928 [Salix brachista]|uniref:Inositol polyphosphate-related phosphatase domain-containing protein n=1 Tax=Salix brachista TaxID=2182728 RepID=A0A5N5JES7_9ROSI|nr:hypothetical protein DKX38_026928 [Salix brachista]